MSTDDAPAAVSAPMMLRRLEELEHLLGVDDELAALTATVATMATELQRSAPTWTVADQELVARRVDALLEWALERKRRFQQSLQEHSRGRRATAGYTR